MVMFIAFVIAILSVAVCGYLLGNGRTIKRNTETDTSDVLNYSAAAGRLDEAQSIVDRDNERAADGITAGKKIQDVITGIRRGSDGSDNDDSNKGGD